MTLLRPFIVSNNRIELSDRKLGDVTVSCATIVLSGALTSSVNVETGSWTFANDTRPLFLTSVQSDEHSLVFTNLHLGEVRQEFSVRRKEPLGSDSSSDLHFKSAYRDAGTMSRDLLPDAKLDLHNSKAILQTSIRSGRRLLQRSSNAPSSLAVVGTPLSVYSPSLSVSQRRYLRMDTIEEVSFLAFKCLQFFPRRC